MILSRFWYVILALLLGASIFGLAVARERYNRSGRRAMEEALLADASAVDWYLRDDARKRSAALIRLALSPEIRTNVAKASGEATIKAPVRDKTRDAVAKFSKELPPESRFDAIWVTDASGRVVASYVTAGRNTPEDWDLGGYALVADALHGWMRDDAWVWDSQIYRVVARPIEQEASGEPVGAIVGAKIVDDGFARAVHARTNANVGFFVGTSRIASGVGDEFRGAGLLDQAQDVVKDLQAATEGDYVEKGRSKVEVVNEAVGVVFTRLPGEASDLGGSYAVARNAVSAPSLFSFFERVSAEEQKGVPTLPIVLTVLGLAAAGIVFSFLEHTLPLSRFRGEAARFAKGEVDVLAPSKFRGVYKKIASDVNDGTEKVAAKGGVPRRAADLEQVLGPIPAQPAMSAFSVPGGGSPESSSSPVRPPLPGPPGVPAPRAADPLGLNGGSNGAPASTPLSAPGPTPSSPGKPPPPRRPPPPPPSSAGASVSANSSAGLAVPISEASSAGMPAPAGDEMTEWQRVYDEFLAVKRQCGEPTESLTFDKFKGTLQRNKDALVSRHNCQQVRFTVYVKEGKAALKASPVK